MPMTSFKIPKWSCTWMVIATLFIIAKTWKRPRCPIAGEQVNKSWHFQTMEQYSALKRHELLNHENTWRNLKGLLQSEISPCEKAACCVIPTLWHSGKGNTMAKGRSVFARGQREGGMNRWNTEDFQGSETTLCDPVMMEMCHYVFVQSTQCTPPRVKPHLNGGLWLYLSWGYHNKTAIDWGA